MNISFSKKIISYFFHLLLILIILFPIFHFDKTDNRYRRDKDQDLFKECEKLEESIKKYENNIQELIEKNQDGKLQIEINKVYIKFLYALIIVFLFIILSIAIIKIYSRCIEKNKSVLTPNFGDTLPNSFPENNNGVNNKK